MTLTIDPRTGLAGDMMIASLLDAGVDHDDILKVIRFAAGLLGEANIRAETVNRAGVTVCGGQEPSAPEPILSGSCSHPLVPEGFSNKPNAEPALSYL